MNKQWTQIQKTAVSAENPLILKWIQRIFVWFILSLHLQYIAAELSKAEEVFEKNGKLCFNSTEKL